jgi:hypothetical protein
MMIMTPAPDPHQREPLPFLGKNSAIRSTTGVAQAGSSRLYTQLSPKI